MNFCFTCKASAGSTSAPHTPPVAPSAGANVLSGPGAMARHTPHTPPVAPSAGANVLSGPGAMALAAALRGGEGGGGGPWPLLRRVVLAGNAIGAEGAAAMAGGPWAVVH